MFAKIAQFEARYQLGGPVFWVVAILFFLLTFGATSIDEIQIGGGGNVNVNSPSAIHLVTLVMSIFFVMVTTAFVANVIVRDDESGFGPMVRSTRVAKVSYLMGRFTGAFLAAAIAFIFVPLGIFLGSIMPWLDSETVGPNRLAYYANAYFLFGLVNVFITSALFFAVATFTRSMMLTYVAVLAFLVLYFVSQGIIGSDPELRDLGAWMDPFGIGALGESMRYWTAADSNTRLPPISNLLLGNRLLWIGISIAALALAVWRFSFTQKGASKRQVRKQQKRAAKLAAVEPQIAETLPSPDPSGAKWARFWSRMKFEARQIMRSPAFFVLLIIGLLNSLGGLYGANQTYGTASLPTTFVVVPVLFGAFSIIPLIIAIYYAGELVWRDKDLKFGEIVDATSLPNWAFLLPKMIALSVVLIATLTVGMLGAILIQLVRGYTEIALGDYFAWYVLPLSVDMIILAALAILVQAISPHKYVGWGIMLVYTIATITLTTIGFEHPLYNYGSTGTPLISGMNSDAVGADKAWWLRLYWGGVALILAVLAHLLWRRGSDTRLMPRLKRMPRRLVGMPGIVALGGLIVSGITGIWLYQNMNVANVYLTSDQQEERLADFEKKYLRYENLPQPALSHVELNVDLDPDRLGVVVDGRYELVNDTDAPIETLHVIMANYVTELTDVEVEGARLETDDEEFNYRIFRFAEPLQPGERTQMTWRTVRERKGITAGTGDTRLVENGTFLNNSEFAPTIGMSRAFLLSDRQTRREYDLPPELRPAKLGDEDAQDANYVGVDWVTSDITMTTSADQTPIAPGSRVSDVTENGRRTARFVADEPILAFFSIQSADYEVARSTSDGVTLEVYYDADHAYNVERMLTAMDISLDYYRKNFGPYQFDYARIVEFPAYATFAQAFAGTMPYSESIGFIADFSEEMDIDYVTYVVAHEMAHQYWAHQLVGANMQGATALSETLAQYSALMVMKELYGEDKIRRFLKYELDNYLSARGSEALEELPLMTNEGQGYIHYRKGSLVMYLMQDRFGEDRVNAALSDMLERWRFAGPPYPMATELTSRMLRLAQTDADRELVKDLFARITLWDLKVEDAETRKLPDGRFETTVTTQSAKYYADGEGAEREAPLDDRIGIGLFTERPGYGEFDAEDVIGIARRDIESGTQTFTFVTRKRPAFVGIDPYNKYIDRNSEDNVFALETS